MIEKATDFDMTETDSEFDKIETAASIYRHCTTNIYVDIECVTS